MKITNKTFNKTLVAATVAISLAQASAASFSINLEYFSTSDEIADTFGDFSDDTNYSDVTDYEGVDYSFYFENAVSYWENIITDYAVTVPENFEFTLSVGIGAIDGNNGTLGAAGTTSTRSFFGSDYVFAATGAMLIDTSDLDNSLLQDIIYHEVAHALGFGSLWEVNGLYIEDSGEYTGAYALSAYQQLYDDTATYIEVELDGGDGTADAHWDEDVFGDELMTGFISSDTYLSEITIQSFADLGYVVNSSLAVPEPSMLALLSLSLILLSCNRRKRAS